MSRHSPSSQDSDQLVLFSDTTAKATKESSRAYSHLEKVMGEIQAERKSFSSKEEYYQSPAWRVKRREKLEQVGYRCGRCGKGTGLDVHHLNYDSLYDEHMEDLEVVCRGCHGVADDQREWSSGLSSYAVKKYGDDYGGDLSDVDHEFATWLRKKRDSDW